MTCYFQRDIGGRVLDISYAMIFQFRLELLINYPIDKHNCFTYISLVTIVVTYKLCMEYEIVLAAG